MMILSLLLGAAVVALSFLCVRWNRCSHKLVAMNRRLELVIELDNLIMNNAPESEIRDAKMAIIDFDRRHYNGRV